MSDQTHVDQMSLFTGIPEGAATPNNADQTAGVDASRPSLAQRCTGILFCHRCGAPTSRAADAEFCPVCHARRCTTCGDV